MKTFSTSGTGNQQTLSEIENNKIPVYETKTDAESDLANLTVGQIIATKDEGNETSTPVDVVEDGNMHAVTSNAVADSLSYSTTETLTGGKWIDGKPIYRKVISGIGYWDGNLAIETGITNIDELINLSFIESGVTGTYAGRIFVGTNRSESSWFINKSTGVVGTDGRSTGVTGTNGILIIEYTKTTD